jgi:hypothetical protein
LILNEAAEPRSVANGLGLRFHFDSVDGRVFGDWREIQFQHVVGGQLYMVNDHHGAVAWLFPDPTLERVVQAAPSLSVYYLGGLPPGK